jgi:hypothetical protein
MGTWQGVGFGLRGCFCVCRIKISKDNRNL